MTAKRSRPVTGVARGSLGTGTALDDTQVYQVADLVPPAPAAAPKPAPAQRVPRPVPAPVAVTPTNLSRAEPSPEVARPVVRRRRTVAATRAPGFAWIAGTALVAVVVTAIVSSGLGAGHPGAGLESGAPAAIVPATEAPSAAPSEATGGGGGGGGNGHGNGNGGGNGNGHGGGGDH
jgi:uncharacterized membrane protein YgcG